MADKGNRHNMEKHQNFSLFHRFVFLLISVFYGQIEIDGREKIPNGRVIFVANHPNGLLDPIIIMMSVGYKLRFLAMSKLFAMPIISWACHQFDALPIYRASDSGMKGGPTDAEDAAARNEHTFADARAYLQSGGSIALFPEGTTHSDPLLLPLRTGAARLALGTEVENNWQTGLTIVPVGLWYERKRKFRSSVLCKVGEPFTLLSYQESYVENDRQTVRDLTADIKEKLDDVVLQAEETDILRVVPFVSDLIAHPDKTDELHEVHEWSYRLINTHKALQERDPERLERITDRLKKYANALRVLGVTDPWSLETEQKSGQVWRAAIWLILSSPFALVGMILGFIPYKGAQFLAKKIIPYDTTQTSLIKSVGGLLFFLAVWIAVTAVGGSLWGWIGGVLAFLLTPALCSLALAWVEVYTSFKTLRHHRRIRYKRLDSIELLVTQREEIAEEILSAVTWAEQL